MIILRDIIENLNPDRSIKEKVVSLRVFLEGRYKKRLKRLIARLGDSATHVEQEFKKIGIDIGKLKKIPD